MCSITFESVDGFFLKHYTNVMLLEAIMMAFEAEATLVPFYMGP
jgi:hypothetical protein